MEMVKNVSPHSKSTQKEQQHLYYAHLESYYTAQLHECRFPALLRLYQDSTLFPEFPSAKLKESSQLSHPARLGRKEEMV